MAQAITDYKPPNEAPDKITVGGVRVPAVGDGVTVDIRKEAIAHITRYGTVTTRYEVDGEFYGEWLNVDLHNGYKPVRIQLRDHRSPGEWTTVMHGYLGAWGGTENENIRFEVRDPATLLGEIGASTKFGDATVGDVLNYVADTFENEQPIYDDVIVLTNTTSTQVYEYGITGVGPSTIDIGETTVPILNVPTLKFDNVLKNTFEKHRDTLLDVLEWVQDRANVRFWFQPTDDDSTIVLRVVDVDELPSLTRKHSGSTVNGEVDILTNNALYEISPQNAVEVTGGAIGSRDPQTLDSQYQLETPPQKAVSVTVQADPLVKRAGGQIVAKTVTGDFSTKEAVENVARSQLKAMIDSESGGTITTQLAPNISIFDQIEAHPVSQNITQGAVSELTYEVERLVHTTNTNKRLPHTTCNVSTHVSPRDISLVDVTWGEV